MGLRIRTNTMSLTAQRHLSDSGKRLRKSMENLSSGRRINKAADDAAGLAISEVVRSDIRSLSQAKRNTNDGISLIQVAEGSLKEIGSIVVRLKELAVQGASDNIGPRERKYLNFEFMELKNEIDRIALSTEFNGTRLLLGKTENLADSITERHQVPPFEIQVDKNYRLDIDSLDKENPVNIIRLDFEKINAMTSGEGSLNIGKAHDEDGTRVDEKHASQMSIRTLDQSIEKLARHRAHLGSLQNRLESTDRNLDIRITSLSNARSRIADADIAYDTAEYTQWGIIQQAGAAVLAQANQMPQLALKLIQG